MIPAVKQLSKLEQARWANGIEMVLRHEGGFVDDPTDPGGATNWGISLRFLRGLALGDADIDRDGDIDRDDVAKLTREQAAELYFRHFWLPGRYGELADGVSEKVFDLSVNVGPRQAHRIVQRALRSCGRHVADDGILGPVTRTAILLAPPGPLLAATRSEAAGFYRSLVAGNPGLSKYLAGWLNRAYC